MLTGAQISEFYPIGAICVYGKTGTATLLRSPIVKETKSRMRGERQPITHLSRRSLSRLIFLTQVTTVQLNSMLTLTYLCPPANGKEAKEHLRQILQWIRRRCRGELEYIWFAEFTQNGSVHFHVLLTCEPTEDDRLEMSFRWLRITDQGKGRYCSLRQRKETRVMISIIRSVSHENTWSTLRHKDGAKRYITKYAAKPYQKMVPEWFRDMGRFWGVSKGVFSNRDDYTIYLVDEDELRDELQRQGHPAAAWEFLPRHIWTFDPRRLKKVDVMSHST